jgi:hypothetical protein
MPNNMKNFSQKDDKRTLVQCSSCATVFHYDRCEGICPNCGKYNQLTGNTFYVENIYKSKKAIFAVFKSIGMIILIFVVIIVGTLIKYKLDENNEPDGMNIKIPAFNFEVGEEKDKTEINDYKDNSKNSDNTNNLEEGEHKDSSENLENKNTLNFTPDEINMLLDEIKEEDNLEATYHKEIYKNNLTDDSGEKYNEITILIANNESEKVYWYKFYKYLKTSEKYKEGEIVFYMGAESSTLTKSDIINE